VGEVKPKHGEPERKRAEHNAGALLGAGGIQSIPVPMSTLSDEYHDEPTEPEDSERVPEPEPPGSIRRVIDRLTRRLNP
jgi:hypothetical protein